MAANNALCVKIALAVSFCVAPIFPEDSSGPILNDDLLAEAIGLHKVSVVVEGDGWVKLVVFRKGMPLQASAVGREHNTENITVLIQGSSPFDREPKRLSVVLSDGFFFNRSIIFPRCLTAGSGAP